MHEFNEHRFRLRVDNALGSVRRVLDTNRNPELPSSVQHTYDDKYTLTSLMTNCALAATALCFTELGVTAAHLKTLRDWAKTKSVTIRFSAERRCAFDREVKREVESATKHVTETTLFGKFTDKTVTTVIEYFWKFDAEWEISAYAGTNVAESIVLLGRKAHHELMTLAKTTPQPTVTVENPREVNVTWYLNQLNADGKFAFVIDRSPATCHTPRRNGDVERAIEEFGAWRSFTAEIQGYLQNALFPIQTGHGLDLNALYNTTAFIPVIPLFEKGSHVVETKTDVVIHAGPPANSACLSLADTGKFLDEQKRSLIEAYEKLTSTFPAKGALITSLEAKVVVVAAHAQRLVEAFQDAVDYVEILLYKQLIAAIGKEVQPVDFAEYMSFHARKLFKAEYQPKGFCYAIRRPDHYPEGTLSIESHDSSSSNIAEPLQTTVRASTASTPMYFAINAATKVGFFGQRYLHGCVLHRFSDQQAPNMSLVARARQFSSFILLVGTILSKDEFKPTYATIIQNKDELTIPLLLETLPTPKEFADAIESLSPEQQRFCKAFRSMQLASTLFGVVIIQIKPQLERVLNLPDDSLTKEIRLTQDLMEMFIKYQIPSDLLSFEGNNALSPSEKLGAVKRNVQAIQEMIQGAKDQELKEAAEERVKLELSRNPPPVAFFGGMKDSVEKSKSGGGGGARGGAMLRGLKMSSSSKESRKSSAPSLDLLSLSDSMMAPSESIVEPSAPPPSGGESAPVVVAAPSPQLTVKGDAKPKPPPPPSSAGVVAEDYTALPGKLDTTLSALDSDHAVRATIIKPGTQWLKNFQKGLLSKPSSMTMLETEQKEHKNSAYDLLDALSRSGVLSVNQAELHVVLMATHCFDKTLVETVIQDNVNPIEKVERSALIVASTIYSMAPLDMVRSEERSRVETYAPTLTTK